MQMCHKGTVCQFKDRDRRPFIDRILQYSSCLIGSEMVKAGEQRTYTLQIFRHICRINGPGFIGNLTPGFLMDCFKGRYVGKFVRQHDFHRESMILFELMLQQLIRPRATGTQIHSESLIGFSQHISQQGRRGLIQINTEHLAMVKLRHIVSRTLRKPINVFKFNRVYSFHDASL